MSLSVASKPPLRGPLTIARVTACGVGQDLVQRCGACRGWECLGKQSRPYRGMRRRPTRRAACSRLRCVTMLAPIPLTAAPSHSTSAPPFPPVPGISQTGIPKSRSTQGLNRQARQSVLPSMSVVERFELRGGQRDQPFAGIADLACQSRLRADKVRRECCGQRIQLVM